MKVAAAPCLIVNAATVEPFLVDDLYVRIDGCSEVLIFNICWGDLTRAERRGQGIAANTVR